MTSATSDATRSLSETGHKRISSFPSRQRRMGPAPLASFEDLSMDKANSDSSPEDKTVLSNIEEMSGHVTPVSPSMKDVLSLPTSPRIRVSAASSPSQHESDSKESTPDKELFKDYKKSEFCEDQLTDLKDSTDELESEGNKKKKKHSIEKIRGKIEVDQKDEALKIADLIRKGSSSSIVSDNLMPITSAHSSRLSSLGSIGSPVRRSPSPHKMLLETSFCGNKPIQHPSIDIEDPPIPVSKLMTVAIAKLENYKSPEEVKNEAISEYDDLSPSVKTDRKFSSSKRKIEEDAQDASEEGRRQHVVQKKLEQSQPKSLQRRQVQQRRQAEHQEYHQRQTEQSDVSKSEEYGESVLSDPEVASHEKQCQQDKKQSGTKSPRLGKKVPLPQIPGVKDSTPSAGTMPYVSQKSEQLVKSEPDNEFVRQSRKRSSNKKKQGVDKIEVTAADSRKGSFTSIFKRAENALSPDTPDSPSSTSGRKSPFSQFIKSAKNELRSRSRSRSRSKDRDRDLRDDTHDRRKKFSLFKPKKKKDSEKKGDISSTVVDAVATSSTSSYPMEISEPLDSRNGFTKDQLRTSDIYDGFIEINSRPHSKPCSPSLSASARETFSTFKPPDNGESQLPEAKSTVLKSDKIENKQLNMKALCTSHSNIADISKDQSNDPDAQSISESDKYSEVLEELKKKKFAASGERAISPDVENKGLVSQESFEDDELPFVPTTLPQERSSMPPIVPIRERQAHLKMTQSIDRPRSTTPIQPSKLEAYKQSSQEMLDIEADKMTITIKVPPPGSIKVLPSNVGKGQSSKSWEDFCNEGLKSPRELRHEYRSKQQSTDEDNIPPAPPPPPPPRTPTPLSTLARTPSPSVASQVSGKSQNWIDFNEIPSIVLKPVRQIKTAQQRKDPTELDIKFQQNPATKKLMEELKQHIEKEKLANKEKTADETGSIHESDKEESSEHSSDSNDNSSSASSCEELAAASKAVSQVKNNENIDLYENSDLEKLLAPVNECISRLSSLSMTENASYDRKSPIPDNWEDFLLPPQPGRRSRLSSISSDIGSIGRSPSPSHMILETSFCGSQPIDDPAMAEPDVPMSIARKLSGISLGDLGSMMSRGDRGSIQSSTLLLQPDRSSLLSDSSAEGGSPKCGEREFTDGMSRNLHPFGMDLNVKSNRSSIISQDQSPPDTPFCASGHPS